MADVQRLARSLASHKGHITRKLANATSLLQSAQTDRSSHITGQLERSIEGIEKAVENMDAAADLYLPELVDDATRGPAEAEVQNYSKDAFDKIAEVNAVLKDLTAPTQPLTVPPTQSATSTKVKPHESLKPDLLHHNFTPVELRAWAAAFKAYHTASNFNKATILEQQAYFLKTLDPQLQERVRTKKRDDTPIFTDPADQSKVSCMKIIEDFFLLKYPMVTRRFQFFNFKQEPGKSFTDFKTALEAKAKEADLHSLTADDLKMFLIVFS